MAEYHKVPVDLFNNIFDYIGTGDPTSPLPNAATGSLYRKLDGVSGSTLWQKTASGWEALQGSSWTQTAADARYVQLAGSTMNSTARLQFPVLTTNSQLVVGTVEIQGYALNNGWVGENFYFDGAQFRYRATGYAGRLYFQGSAVHLDFAPSGSAGAAVTFTNILVGNLSYVSLAPIAGYSLVGGYSGLRMLTDSYFGLSTTYKCIVVGDLGGSNRAVSIGYDPVSNTGGSFSGTGIEVFWKNAIVWMMPNAANTNYLTMATWAAAGSVTFGAGVGAVGIGRFAGWYVSGDMAGLAAEIGISGGGAYVYSYNRTANAYANLTLSGDVMALIATNGSIDLTSTSYVTVHAPTAFQWNDGTNTVRTVACQVVSASAASGTAPDGTIWFQT